MARVSTYLTFDGNTEAAFTFYRSVFGTEFAMPLARFGDMPPMPDMPPMSDQQRNRVLHVALPILGGHVLMGSDSPGDGADENCGGGPLVVGNNVQINLEPDTRAEADRLFAALADGGKVMMAMQEMFWGAYWGSFSDRFGIHWMINCESKT